MTQRNDGGPETLRDFFAGMALIGQIIATPHRFLEGAMDNEIAEAAYEMADAMLAARERT